MRITIAAVGRLKRGPELMLLNDYLDRASMAGRPMALGPVTVNEIDERKARDRAQQSLALMAAVPKGGFAIALDERGETVSSPGFAKMLAELRDRGTAETLFMIGGADGHDQALRDQASGVISLGPMVWPHMLARVMLCEQLYRAATILAGTPYHRA